MPAHKIDSLETEALFDHRRQLGLYPPFVDQVAAWERDEAER